MGNGGSTVAIGLDLNYCHDSRRHAYSLCVYKRISTSLLKFGYLYLVLGIGERRFSAKFCAIGLDLNYCHN